LLPVVRLLFIVAVIFVGLRQVGIAAAYAGAFGFAAIVGVFYVYRLLGFEYRTGITDEGCSMIRFSAPLLVGGATSLIVTDLDVLMLGAMVNSSAVGTYKAVYPLALLLNMTLISVGYLLMPVLSDLHSEGNSSRMREVYRISAKWITALSVPLVYTLLIYPEWVIDLTFGSEYVSGSLALSVLSLGFVTHAVTGPNGDALKSLGHSDVTMYTSIVLGLLNAGLNLLLIPRFSIVGAAAATAFSYFLNNLLNGYILYSRSGISPLSKGLAVVLTVGVGSALFVSIVSQVSSLVSGSALVSLLTFYIVYSIVVGIVGGLRQDIQLVKGLV
jgi:O-antigen/teichoic acid export membrane protein